MLSTHTNQASAITICAFRVRAPNVPLARASRMTNMCIKVTKDPLACTTRQLAQLTMDLLEVAVTSNVCSSLLWRIATKERFIHRAAGSRALDHTNPTKATSVSLAGIETMAYITQGTELATNKKHDTQGSVVRFVDTPTKDVVDVLSMSVSEHIRLTAKSSRTALLS
eukprot:5594318-Amphidinium_carterae.1